MKRWELDYRGDIITVENRWNGERLFVNGQLQDEHLGFFVGRSRMWGRLPGGETVKVSLGGDLRMHCRIFIGDKLELAE